MEAVIFVLLPHNNTNDNVINEYGRKGGISML